MGVQPPPPVFSRPASLAPPPRPMDEHELHHPTNWASPHAHPKGTALNRPVRGGGRGAEGRLKMV